MFVEALMTNAIWGKCSRSVHNIWVNELRKQECHEGSGGLQKTTDDRNLCTVFERFGKNAEGVLGMLWVNDMRKKERQEGCCRPLMVLVGQNLVRRC